MPQSTPQTGAPLGCAVVILIGLVGGGMGLSYLGGKEYEITHEHNWWIIGLFVT